MHAVRAASSEPGLVDVAVAHRYVARYRFREYDTVPHHHSASPAPPCHAVAVDVGTGYVYAPAIDPVIAEHQFNQRGLSAARRSNYGRHLSLRHRECYVVEGVLQRMEVIPEVDVVQRYRTILVVGITGEQLPSSSSLRRPCISLMRSSDIFTS